ncbi:MAG: hypothetical protein Q7T10_03420 [Rhodoferax sp.]|uniref:hypothetical protein n=1 Tax=Rhodoferax sp. TaxID=50421 RepID=UPI0027246AA8|nr:hypothetical protein [Rhodoferax sp.]MDO8447836.1 hypothetical protein [Rhodoferax sp.]
MKAVDVLIHVHPELSPIDRAKVEQEVAASVGVISANFDKHERPHLLIVQYNPDALQSSQILEMVKRLDPDASLVGL